ncbi:MAG: COX15/CtaA family protein [Hyphomicrobiales bacterium]|nr:COX15/CtaA family protein [Hyphomicrobiales bacterium]
MTDTATDSRYRTIRIWLYAVAFLVTLMVLLGGATRLTDSGLSIVEWKPVTGAIPPLTEADWLEELEKYKTIPEYEQINKGFSLDEFKVIYYWEWAHRLFGRLIGLVFFVPLVWFWWKGRIGPGLRGRLVAIFALGGLQGAIGWWMVASGLVNRVDVAQERLAIHLIMACLILIAIVWTARRTLPSMAPPDRRLRRTAIALIVLITVQIFLGGLVAGLKAGLIYNTWPLMDGDLLPPLADLFSMVPAWINLVDNHLTVQFVHRIGAYLVVIVALLHAFDARGAVPQVRTGAFAVAAIALVQVVIGIYTLLLVVPIWLALIHQGVAIVLLAASVVHAERLNPARRQAATAGAEAPVL